MENSCNPSLRPQTFADYVGQEQIKANLKIFIASAQQRNVPLPHCLFSGPPGTGKTSMANIISNVCNTNMYVVFAPMIKKVADIMPTIANLKKSDILFIDEIHTLSKEVMEFLYPVMEDFKLDLAVGENAATRLIRIDVDPFTLIGATTEPGNLEKPFRDRFGIVCNLNLYSVEELATILRASADKLAIKLPLDESIALAIRSRGTPRIANRLLERVRDLALVCKTDCITLKIIEDMLTALGINQYGLDTTDRQLLTILKNRCGNPIGAKTLSMLLNVDIESLEKVHEPYLLQQGYIEKINRGRIITEKAMRLHGLIEPWLLTS